MKEQDGPIATFVQPKLPRVRFFERSPGAEYRPCNGTEGEYFIAMWCEECERDKAMNGTVYREGREENEDDWCEILGRSFRSEEPLPEWIIGDDGQPKCTQFVPVGSTVPHRCDHTADMFSDEASVTPNVGVERAAEGGPLA